MKKFAFLSLFLCIAIFASAQAPQAFKYQSVIRNTDGTPKENTMLTLTFQIVDDGGTVVFSENHTSTTDGFGYFQVEIGSINTQDFGGINWATGPFTLKVKNGSEEIGQSPILSVPYALYASEAPSVTAENKHVSNYTVQNFSTRGTWLDVKEEDGVQNLQVTFTAPGTYLVLFGLRVSSLIAGETAQYRLLNVANPAEIYSNAVVHADATGDVALAIRILEFDNSELPKTFKMVVYVDGTPSADVFVVDDASISAIRIDK